MIGELGRANKVSARVAIYKVGMADVRAMLEQFAARMAANLQRRPEQQP